jgi:hypothetical protein
MEGGLLGRMRKGAAALSEIYDASSVRQEKQTSFKQIRQLSENRALQNLMFDVFPFNKFERCHKWGYPLVLKKWRT